MGSTIPKTAPHTRPEGNLPAFPYAAGPTTPPATLLTPNVLAVVHWNRLLHGALYAATPRVDWATLLRRTFDVDVLRCAHCGGRLRLLGEVVESHQVTLVLDSSASPSSRLARRGHAIRPSCSVKSSRSGNAPPTRPRLHVPRPWEPAFRVLKLGPPLQR